MQKLGAISTLLLPWYDRNARRLPWRETKDPYSVWISEIMLQQTRVEAVVKYYNRFLATLPDIQALACVDDACLYKLWEGLGYYSRARNLKKAAVEIVEKHGGVFPTDYDVVLKLPGIGAYTAGAVCSICFEQKRAAVDGNVMRILSRITNSTEPIDLPKTKASLTALAQGLYPDVRCGDFSQSLMELGATVCTPKSPKCGDCPICSVCLSQKEDTTAVIPVKSKTKPKTEVKKTVFYFIQQDGRVAFVRRPAKGLLAGMWQLPDVDREIDIQEAMTCAKEMGVHPISVTKSVSRKHVFTHIIWHMKCYYIICTDSGSRFVWETQKEAESHLAFPTAYKQFFE